MIRLFRPRFFTRFLAHYLFILVVSFLLGIVMYYVSSRVVADYSRETNLALLKQTQKMIDRRVQIAHFNGIQTARNPNVQFIAGMTKPIAGPDIYVLWDQWQKYAAGQIDNQFIAHSLIYFDNSGIFISPYSIYTRPQYFYDGLFRYADMSRDQWTDMLTNKRFDSAILPSASVYVNGSEERMIAFLQSFPIGGGNNKGTSIALIKERDLYEYMDPLHVGEGAWAYVLDRQGRRILSFPEDQQDLPGLQELPLVKNGAPPEGYTEQEWNGAKLLISYVFSPTSGLTYVAALPEDIVLSKVSMIRHASVQIMALFLFLGIGLAYYLARRNSKPLSGVFKALLAQTGNESSGPGKENYERLRGNVDHLIHSNKTLSQNIAQQQALLREAYWYRLLYGELNDLHDLKAVSSVGGFPPETGSVVVSIVGIQADRLPLNAAVRDKLNLVKELAKNALDEGGGCYFIGYDADKLIWVLSLPAEAEPSYLSSIAERMERANQIVEQSSGFSLYAAAGQLSGRLLDVGRSFEQARAALEYRSFHPTSQVFGFADMPVSSESYYYPLDVELRLYNLSKLGDYDNVAELLDFLWEENFAKRLLSVEMTRQLLHEVQGTLIKAHDQLREEAASDRSSPLLSVGVEELIMTHSPAELLEMVKQAYGRLCGRAVRQEEQKNSSMIAGIKQSIHERYGDANLSLMSLTDQFGCTDKYLSLYFKEQTGENFSTYLENVRLAKACELLANEQLGIEHVAASVGYNSGHAFRRAFKRVMGISPSTYQQMGGDQHHP